MTNTSIRKVKTDIIGYLNAQAIPIEIKRLIISEILTEVNTEAERVIQYEIAQKKKEKNEESGVKESE